MRKIEEIIIHCTATPEGRDVTVEELRRWHKARGFADIGYHYVIARNGEVMAGRSEETTGAHCSGRNAHSIGVCYVGGSDKSGKPKDTRTEAQKASMAELVRQLCARYALDIQKDVHGHREYAAKACPSFDVRAWAREIRQ